jgi:WXG100 family type VII secretion target
MTQIRILPDQVRQVSAQFKQASQDSQQIMNNLTSTLNGMQGDWEGMTQQRFYQDFEQWKASMNQFAQLLDGIGQQLDAYAARVESVDQGG